MPYCNPNAPNEVQKLVLNPKAKKEAVPKLKVVDTDKPPAVETIEKEGPVAESPVAVDFEEKLPEDPPQGKPPGITVTQPGCKAPCEDPHCKHGGHVLATS